jgi:hypothetical protein
MSDDLTKIDKDWESLFEKYGILAHIQNKGSFRISSKQINEVHEARLMAKFDQSARLPEIFKKNKLSILPVARGDYLIGPFLTHIPIYYKEGVIPQKVENPQLETLNPSNLYSEASALFFAYNSGIISDIMGGSNNVKFTVNGRMGSGEFSFSIQNQLQLQKPTIVSVKNSQIEIDAGFESPEAFLICEAKNHASEELLIRQLYYPYRLWSEKIAKPVIPVFLAFSNDVFHAFIYAFEDKQDYNSIYLKNYKAYTFADEDISLQDIKKVWQDVSNTEEPNVAFPQADSFERVLDLLSVLHEEDLTRTEVTLKYEFDPRQTNYYVAACKYLGLVEAFSAEYKERGYRLTVEARRIMSLPYKKKILALIKKIFERQVFKNAFGIFMESNCLPSRQTIYQIIKTADISKPINDITINRRASTVLSWLGWMITISVAE